MTAFRHPVNVLAQSGLRSGLRKCPLPPRADAPKVRSVDGPGLAVTKHGDTPAVTLACQSAQEIRQLGLNRQITNLSPRYDERSSGECSTT